MKEVLVVGGDGIGPEVISQAVRVIQSLDVSVKFVAGDAGLAAYERFGTSLPEETLRKAQRADAVLFGAVTTPPDIKDYHSAILGLRKSLNLYANLRPVRSVPLPGSPEGVDMLIVRENTEGLYAGKERLEDGGRTAITERIITASASERIARFAFELATREQRRKVTIVHKANVLRESCGLFRRTCLEVAKRYPGITTDDCLVDSMAMRLIREPQRVDVLLTTNLFGDILSDEASMLGGGLGLAASANIGERHALFEPVHGSAPDITGTGVANPFASILSAAMMLSHLGYPHEASAVQHAIEMALRRGKTTPDLGGRLGTEQATDAVLSLLSKEAIA